MSWLAPGGFFSQRREDLPDPAVAKMPVPTVASGGRSLSLQSLPRSGVTLLGRPQSVQGRTLTFDGTAAANAAFAYQFVTTLRGLMDTMIEGTGVEAPAAEPDDFGGPVDIPEVPALDLDAAHVRSIVWCTGFPGDFSWIELPVLDESGQPRHLHGATDDPGLWFVGLPWLTTRSWAESFGMPVDAERIAGQVRTHLEARG